MKEALDELDQHGVAAAAAACVRAEIAAGCRLLELAALWADHHPAEGVLHERTPLAIAGERTMRFGGPGTPEVAEFAPAELGLEIGMNPIQATGLIADALDLRHRLPRLWVRIQSGEVPAWQARRVAQRTRHLTVEQAGRIDRRLARVVGQLSRGRLDNLIEAEILRVDRQHAERAAIEAARARFVRIARGNDLGHKEVWARLDVADAVWLDGMVDRLADILMTQPDRVPAGVSDRDARSKEEWRAVALGVLGRPMVALRLLADHEQPDLFPDCGVDLIDSNLDPKSSASGRECSGSREERDVQTSPGQREQLLMELAHRIDPGRFTPAAVLHVHIAAEKLPGLAPFDRPGERDGVARVEGVGAALLASVRQWLGSGCRVRLQPIIDSDRMPAVDAYEVPDRMVDALLTRSPGSVFPWSGHLSRRMDVDHTIPYAGPPGQTALANLGPMSRREHRFKTFGRLAVRQPTPGTFVWRSRFGRVIITNPSGTHDLGTGTFADAVWAVTATEDLVPAA